MGRAGPGWVHGQALMVVGQEGHMKLPTTLWRREKNFLCLRALPLKQEEREEQR